MIVQKGLQQRGQRRSFFRERGDKIKGNRLIGELVQAQIGQNKTQAVFTHGDSDREPGIRNDVQALGFASAGGLFFPGVLHQAFFHQLVQILIQCGHADAAFRSQHLLGTEFLCVIQGVIDFAPDRNRSLSGDRCHLYRLPSFSANMRNCASYSILLYYFNTLFKRVNGLLQLKKDAFKKA